MNPGPDTLNPCTWNLNSTTAHDFLRVLLLEAYNSVYNYDLIGIVETHLDTTINEDRLAIDGYTFHKSNHPLNVKRGGVGLYVKDSLASKNRPDLVTLPECVVSEIQIDRKKYFFAVIYRSPSQDQSEFDNFTINFELLLSKIHAEDPFCVIITGDFNCRSTQWWENDVEDNEGRLFEPFTSELGLHQLISERTHLKVTLLSAPVSSELPFCKTILLRKLLISPILFGRSKIGKKDIVLHGLGNRKICKSQLFH